MNSSTSRRRSGSGSTSDDGNGQKRKPARHKASTFSHCSASDFLGALKARPISWSGEAQSGQTAPVSALTFHDLRQSKQAWAIRYSGPRGSATGCGPRRLPIVRRTAVLRAFSHALTIRQRWQDTPRSAKGRRPTILAVQNGCQHSRSGADVRFRAPAAVGLGWTAALLLLISLFGIPTLR